MGHGCSCGCSTASRDNTIKNEIKQRRYIIPARISGYLDPAFSLMLLTGGMLIKWADISLFYNGIAMLLWYAVAYLPVGLPVVINALRSVANGDYFSEHSLMTIATAGALFGRGYARPFLL